MKRTRRLMLIGLGVLVPSLASALEVEVTAPAPGDTLIAGFRLQGIFDEGSKLGDGIPATLVLVVDLWRERNGWWDSLVRSQAFTYRFRRDIWSGEVDLWGVDRSHSLLPDRESLIAYLEREHEIVLGVPEGFAEGRGYYLTVKAIIQPMNMDDLENVDAWLSGEVTGGKGILGIPRALARVVVDVSGLGDTSVEGRSRIFVPRP